MKSIAPTQKLSLFFSRQLKEKTSQNYSKKSSGSIKIAPICSECILCGWQHRLNTQVSQLYYDLCYRKGNPPNRLMSIVLMWESSRNGLTALISLSNLDCEGKK